MQAERKVKSDPLCLDEEIAQIFIYSSDGVAMHMVMEGAKIEEMVKPFMILWDKLYEQIKA